ncbi:MAG TPA: rhodanese-like domain-containing protein, partial [Thermomicrobiales bacterium]|nr:rhodanese-like domain-containing protein [Thermomicrobiales bacterium]
HLHLARIIRGEMPEIDRSAEVTVVCGTGYRSMIGAALLKGAGYQRVRNLDGGMGAWSKAEGSADPMAS